MKNNDSNKAVFLINSLTSGGAEKVLSVIISELLNQNIEVELILLEKEKFYSIPDKVKCTYLSNFTNADSSMKKMLYLPIYALSLKRYLKENNINLLQSHIYRANFVSILAKLFGSKHSIQVVEVISINFFTKRGFSNKVNLLLIRLLYRFSDLIIFKAERMKLEFFNFVSYQKKNKVINNPYDIELIKTLSYEKIDEFKFNQDKRYLINVGRLEIQKNQSLLIQCMKNLDTNIELIILGEGSLRQSLESLISKLNLKERVHLLGNQSNPYKFIHNCDAFILSSNEEGFPNVLIEAMICNKPVISTDCVSGPREILAPKSDIELQITEKFELAENGILCPLDDETSLTRAINTLLGDKEMYDRYVSRSAKKVTSFSSKVIIEKYKEALCVG